MLLLLVQPPQQILLFITLVSFLTSFSQSVPLMFLEDAEVQPKGHSFQYLWKGCLQFNWLIWPSQWLAMMSILYWAARLFTMQEMKELFSHWCMVLHGHLWNPTIHAILSQVHDQLCLILKIHLIPVRIMYLYNIWYWYFRTKSINRWLKIIVIYLTPLVVFNLDWIWPNE